MLLAYAKLSLYAELLESPVPDDPYLGRELLRYFPKELSAGVPRRAGDSTGCAARSSPRSLPTR